MPATYWPPAPTRYPAFYFSINDHSLGTEIQLTILSTQLEIIIKLILVKSLLTLQERF